MSEDRKVTLDTSYNGYVLSPYANDISCRIYKLMQVKLEQIKNELQ